MPPSPEFFNFRTFLRKATSFFIFRYSDFCNDSRSGFSALVCTRDAILANLRVYMLSLRWFLIFRSKIYSEGENAVIIIILPFLSNWGYRTMVSGSSRYGIILRWLEASLFPLLSIALRTLPRLDNDWFILVDSRIRVAFSLWDFPSFFPNLSLPARSQKFIVVDTVLFSSFLKLRFIRRIRWDRELRSLNWVVLVFLASLPIYSIFSKTEKFLNFALNRFLTLGILL